MTEDELRQRLKALRGRESQVKVAARIRHPVTGATVSRDWLSRHEADDPEKARQADISITDAYMWAAAFGYGLIVELVPPNAEGKLNPMANQVIGELAVLASHLSDRDLRMLRNLARSLAAGDDED